MEKWLNFDFFNPFNSLNTRVLEIIGELFELSEIKSILSAFLGETERKTASIDSSSFRDSDFKIEEEP